MTYVILFFKFSLYILEDIIFYLFSKLKYIAVITIFICGLLSLTYFSNPTNVNSEKIFIQIPAKSTFQHVMALLEEKKLINSKLLFKQFSQFIGYDRKIRSGEYLIPKGFNDYFLVNFLFEAKPQLRKLTIIEGLRFSKIIPKIVSSLNLDSLKLISLFDDKQFLTEKSITAKNIEGYILPETYHFSWGRNEKSIISFLIDKTKSILDKYRLEIEKRKLTDLEILTMASIIQGECIYADEMSIVSSVYWNRMKIGMKLQAGPTIQYFLNKPTRLRFRHLRIDNPYNTYIYNGLPPGPINNPGQDAIFAAIFPKETKYLYFVADGTGRHTFGKTLKEHNINRIPLDKLRLKLWREKRYGNKKK